MGAVISEDMGFLVNLAVLIAGTGVLMLAAIGCCLCGCLKKKQPNKPDPVA